MVWIKCAILCLCHCLSCVCIRFRYLLNGCTLSLSLSFAHSHIPQWGWQWHKPLHIIFLSVHLDILSSLCLLSYFFILNARLHPCPVMGFVKTKWSYSFHFLMHDFYPLHVILLSCLSQPFHHLVHLLWIISGSQPYCMSLLPFSNFLFDNISTHILTEGVGSLYQQIRSYQCSPYWTTKQSMAVCCAGTVWKKSVASDMLSQQCLPLQARHLESRNLTIQWQMLGKSWARQWQWIPHISIMPATVIAQPMMFLAYLWSPVLK